MAAVDLKDALLLVLRLTHPVTSSVPWIEIFAVEGCSEAQGLLERLQDGRQRVTAQLTQSSSSWSLSEVLGALEGYLPDITTLLESLDKQSTVLTKKILQFEWKGSLSAPGSESLKCPFIIFELCMCIHSLGFANYSQGVKLLAPEQMASNPSLQLKEASKAFLQAASYWKCLGSSTLPRWVTRNSLKRYPPELDECVALAMMHLAQAAAQQCAIVVAMLSGTAKSALLSKLAAAVVRDAEDCLRFFGQAAAKCEKVSPDVLMHAAYLRDFYTSFAMFQHAQELVDTRKVGEALSAYDQSISKLKLQSGTGAFNPDLPGLPRSLVRGPVEHAIGQLLTVLNEQREKYNKENELIFFQVISHAPLPPGILLTAATEFKLPSSGKIVSFQKTTLESVFDSATSLTSSHSAVKTAEHGTTDKGSTCSACTFINSKDMENCEMCGNALTKVNSPDLHP